MGYNPIHHHYNKQLKPIARRLRKNMTKAEAALWKYGLKKKQRRGYTFNRQRPVLDYVADFMCKKLSLIIEIDGSSHDHPQARRHDQERHDKLEAAGYTVLRFTNEEVLDDMTTVCMRIDEEIALLEAKET
ncbi:MAG: endonuclease domain-containing protein [Gracilimonas sp.]|uniref:endonuclease domain-containing protein n=1 Tax=Gracilimonas sp. TaxID=1974203 RepID=UPI0019BBF549|nr:endonuclease domain-containing protein [Gracilimonas sp.]MBD3617737.1 endonuclease domain-containing protein [Gracilimonas sp.]